MGTRRTYKDKYESAVKVKASLRTQLWHKNKKIQELTKKVRELEAAECESFCKESTEDNFLSEFDEELGKIVEEMKKIKAKDTQLGKQEKELEKEIEEELDKRDMNMNVRNHNGVNWWFLFQNLLMVVLIIAVILNYLK